MEAELGQKNKADRCREIPHRFQKEAAAGTSGLGRGLPPCAQKDAALAIRNLSVSFRLYGKGWAQAELRAIRNLSLTLRGGEILAVAGSSGSGKSLLAHAILGILPRNAAVGGEMLWFGENLTAALQTRLRGKELALVPQSVAYLDPMMRVGKQVSRDKKAVRTLFGRHALDEGVMRRYPHQLSGGMARRILLCTALAGQPKVVVADEPTPGLSARLAEHAMAHFRELAEKGAAVLLITHDLDLALRCADRIAVFYAGTTVETAPASDWAGGGAALRHPYSRALWGAMPQNGFRPIAGAQPYAGALPDGCPFSPRCDLATEKCRKSVPQLREAQGGEVCCFHGNAGEGNDA